MHEYVQTPEAHDRDPLLAVEQGALHEPQWATLLETFSSQPSSTLPGCGPLQSPKEGLHVYEHVPPLHVLAVLFVVEHAPPHEPQCETFVAVSTSQPSSVAPGCGPLQSANAPLHV